LSKNNILENAKIPTAIENAKVKYGESISWK
jgi:hypothetical protein